jgi:hypothetical protein
MLNIDGGAQSARVFGYVIAEDDRAHRGFTTAGFALRGSIRDY